MGLGGVDEERQEKRQERGGGTAPAFIGPAAWGEGPPRIKTSPESGTPIGPDPSRGPLTGAGNRLTLFPARPSQTADILRSDPTR